MKKVEAESIDGKIEGIRTALEERTDALFKEMAFFRDRIHRLTGGDSFDLKEKHINLFDSTLWSSNNLYDDVQVFLNSGLNSRTVIGIQSEAGYLANVDVLAKETLTITLSEDGLEPVTLKLSVGSDIELKATANRAMLGSDKIAMERINNCSGLDPESTIRRLDLAQNAVHFASQILAAKVGVISSQLKPTPAQE